MGYIYLIRNKINGKGYVGQTTWPIEKRWTQHIIDANGLDKKKKCAIHHAFIKYGVENFSFNIVERPKDEDLDDREQYWIKYWHTCVYDEQCNGYNLTWGGGGIRIIDPQTIIDLWNQDLSEGEIVKRTGHSDIAISNILKSHGISSTEIIKRGIDRAAKNNRQKIYQYSLTGDFIKEWSSIKDAAKSIGLTNSGSLSEYLKSLKTGKNGRRSCGNYLWVTDKNDLQKALDKYNNNKYKKNRPVGQFDLENNLIATFQSVTKAQEQTGIDRSQIAAVCNKKPKHKTAGGYIWRYMDEEN